MGEEKEADFLDPAVVSVRLLPSVLFGTLGVVAEEQSEGGVAEQKGLDKPQAASAHVADTFVTAGTRRRNTTTKVKPWNFDSYGQAMNVKNIITHTLVVNASKDYSAMFWFIFTRNMIKIQVQNWIKAIWEAYLLLSPNNEVPDNNLKVWFEAFGAYETFELA